VRDFDNDPAEEMKEFFAPLKSLNKLKEAPERKAALRTALAQMQDLEERYRGICVKLQEQLDELQSPEDLAALTAPQDEKSLLMQGLQDSSLRQLSRLTNMLFKVRSGALTRRDGKNEDRPGYVHENTGDGRRQS
jgi:hypothetical protein